MREACQLKLLKRDQKAFVTDERTNLVEDPELLSQVFCNLVFACDLF